MSKEVYPTINLEITLPQIIFPTINQPTNQDRSQTQAEQHPTEKINQLDEPIQIYLLPLTRHSDDEPSPIVADMSLSMATRKGQFQLQYIKNIAARGQRYVLQVLRPGKQKQLSAPTQHERNSITEELVFSLTYEQPPIHATQHVEIIPGLNQLVILLNNENIPISYTVDGSEN